MVFFVIITYLSCHYGMPQPNQFGGAFLCPLPALTKSKTYDIYSTHTTLNFTITQNNVCTGSPQICTIIYTLHHLLSFALIIFFFLGTFLLRFSCSCSVCVFFFPIVRTYTYVPLCDTTAIWLNHEGNPDRWIYLVAVDFPPCRRNYSEKHQSFHVHFHMKRMRILCCTRGNYTEWRISSTISINVQWNSINCIIEKNCNR